MATLDSELVDAVASVIVKTIWINPHGGVHSADAAARAVISLLRQPHPSAGSCCATCGSDYDGTFPRHEHDNPQDAAAAQRRRAEEWEHWR